MSEETLLTDLDTDGILTITFNRPAVRNALDLPVQRYLFNALYAARHDPGVRVVVLRGAGSAFSAGGDLSAFGTIDEGHPLADKWGQSDRWNDPEFRTDRLFENAESSRLLHHMPKPTIAMVRGPAAGAGMSLALACDFRIGSPSAAFVSAFSKIGTSGDYGGSYFLTKLVGPAKAKEIYMLSDKVTGEEAYRLGLLNRLVAEDDLETETMAFARRLAKGPPVALRYIKANINAALNETFEQVVDQESRHMMRCITTQDGKEAGAAFREKREPKYQGR